MSDTGPVDNKPLAQAAITQLSAPELKAMIDSGAAFELVDVRTEEERALAKIEGARLLDRAYHDYLLTLDRDTPLVFQCHHGIRSQAAAEYLPRRRLSQSLQPARRHRCVVHARRSIRAALLRRSLSMPLTLLVVLLTVLADAQAQGPPALDPCTLVTQAEAEQVIGKLKSAPKGSTVERVKTCEYAGANGEALELWVFPESGLERARATHKDLTPIADLGQPAFFRRNPDIGWVEIYTRKGQVTLEVTMKAATGADEKVKALAKKAIARM